MQKIESKNQITQKISYAKESGTFVVAWFEDDERVRTIDLLITRIDHRHEAIELRAMPEVRSYLDDMISQNRKEVKIYLPQGSFYFFTSLVSNDSNGSILIKTPEILFLKERRSSERAYPSNQLRVVFSINQLRFNKTCHDLGPNGLSVIFNHSEQSGLKENDQIESMTIEYNGQCVSLKAEVHEVIKLRPFVYENIPYGHKRVSFVFTSIKKGQQKDLKELISLFKEELSIDES